MLAQEAQSWLERKVAERDDVVSALVVLHAPDGLRTAATWPADLADSGELERVARTAFGERRRIVEPGPRLVERRNAKSRVFSRPLTINGECVGAVALTVSAPQARPAGDDASADPKRALRDPPGAHESPHGRDPPPAHESRQGRDPRLGTAPAFGVDAPTQQAPLPPAAPSVDLGTGKVPENAQRLLDLVAVALDHGAFAQAATAVANELTHMLGCDRACIGFVDRRSVRVEAVSHSADMKMHARPLIEIGAAMDEALDQGVAIHFPPLPGDRPRITLAHADLAQRQGSGAICTVPLVHAGELVGAILCDRRNAQPFDDESIALLEDIGATLAPLLDLKRERDRSGVSRLGGDLAAALRAAGRPRHRRVKALVALLLLGLVALPLVPVDYRVSAPARLEGAVQRTLVAPADGFLKQVHARPGDPVRQGELLAELADEDLNFEKRRWESEVVRYESVFSEALARQERSQVVIAQARAAEARAQLDLINQQIARSRIVAPFDGIVIRGDLKQQLGAPVRRGDTLMVVAPATEFRVVVEVDERDIGAVGIGQRGEIAFAALPNRNYPVNVERIKPVASTGDGRNYFEVEAALGATESGLRPGLEGVAKIDIDRRPLYWVIGHRALDWLRLALWTWTR